MINIHLPERPLENREKAFIYALVAISSCNHGPNDRHMADTMRTAKQTADELFKDDEKES